MQLSIQPGLAAAKLRRRCGAQPFEGGLLGADHADAQAGGGAFGEATQVDDVAVTMVGGERRGGVAFEMEVARPVVLDQEGAGGGEAGEHLGATCC